MNWISKHLDIGEVKINKEVTIEFKFDGDAKPIKNLNSSCGCSIPYYDEVNKLVRVKFTPGAIPVHLKKFQDFYVISNKTVTIRYKDGSQDVLSFSGIAIK